MQKLLQGKVVVITGSATGIGQCAARLFAEEGAKVVIADINDKDGQETARGIREQGNEAIFVHADLASVKDTEAMIETAVHTYGRLDVFWHNADMSFPGHIDLVKEEEFDKQMAVGLKGAVFGTKFAIREMRKVGGGCILFTSSMVGLRPSPYDPTYSLTHMLEKASLVMLVRCLVEPLAKDNIRVNCICPGPVRTPRWDRGLRQRAEKYGINQDELLRRRISRIPLGRTITMEEVAQAGLWLCSDKASAITGVGLAVDGGFAAV